jgi:protein-tyrosine-phosphatase
MAQALASRVLGGTAIVDSAGIDADTGAPANSKAIVVMEKYGLDIKGHRSKDVEDLDLGAFDIIVAMKSWIARILVSEYGADPARLKELDIDDPHRGGLEEDYEQCAMKLEAVLPAVLQ